MTDALGEADFELLSALRRHDLGLRTVLCTLARHGVALRRDQPLRAQAWLDELAPHPLFKGGQFLFDLLEWEDFMLDGPAPPLLDGPALQQAVARLVRMLRTLTAGPDADAPDPSVSVEQTASREPPDLQSSFYLYHDVVLGALGLLTPEVVQDQRA